MHGWLGAVEAIGAFVVSALLALILLAVRRRWLDRLGGAFDCSLRLRTRRPGYGWALGVARYNEGSLEWYRFFSYSLRPRVVFPRSEARVVWTRDPEPIEAVALKEDERVVRLQVDGAIESDLAMSADSITGLLSWLEAAPPGVRAAE